MGKKPRYAAQKVKDFVDAQYLNRREAANVAAGYNPPKWITFCKWALEYGLTVYLHESMTTVSKYIYLSKFKGGPVYKVRFSNHKPAHYKENAADCDFFVGVANNRTTNTAQAIEAVMAWAKVPGTVPTADF